MATVTANTLVRDPESGELVSLLSGDTVPEWAAGMIGSHLLDESQPEQDAAEAPAQPEQDAAEAKPRRRTSTK